MLSIKEVSPDDHTAISDLVTVLNAATDHDRPGWSPATLRGAYLWRAHPYPGRESEDYVAYLDGEPAGRLELGFTTLDNLNSANFRIDVVPAHRRKGIGRKLYDLMVERVKAKDRMKVMTGSAWSLPGIEAQDGGAGPAFAAAVGLENANLAEVIRRLDLSTVDEAALDALFAKAQEKSAGYRLVQWKNHAPEELLTDIAYLDGRLLTDAPTGDLAIEPENVDADRVRRNDEIGVIHGRSGYHTGAVHEETGRLVAWTTLSTQPGETPWHAWQFITIVDPDHRGHRLGVLVKVANLRYFRQHEPQVKVIDTGNAAENSYMIAINEDMGFRPKWAMQNWQRDL